MDFKKFLNRMNATWRPFGFWGIALGVVYIVFVFPMLYSILSIWGIKISLPAYITSQMMALVTLLLGAAGIRAYEKKTGITDNHGEIDGD